MRTRRPTDPLIFATCFATSIVLASAGVGWGQWHFVNPEERTVKVRDPAELTRAKIPQMPPPSTVYDDEFHATPREISLDEAIRIALANSEVIRVLAGVQAVSSGSTIYDPSISATVIDQEKGRFDPTVNALNSFNRLESPSAIFDPADPTQSRAVIVGSRSDDYNLSLDVTKDTITGGTARLGANTNPTRRQPGIFPLNPSNRSSAELSYTQPLLQGGGIGPNVAPIVLARIDTERSYFRFKDSVQGLVNGVIQAYWALVQARVDLWAREQQVEQAQFAFERAEARFRRELADISEVSQTQLALENFQVSLVNARANYLLREAALRNILGLPPTDGKQALPVTPPTTVQIRPDWDAVLALAEERRPDLIELKLILEADQQLLLQANNQALPRADAVALYRWNGLEGEMPIGDSISTRAGEFADWTLGVNFSVPLGLRAARANLRRQELIIARDRADLDQGLHSVIHSLTLTVRNLAQFYQQYERLTRARAAAKRNLDQQFKEYGAGRVIFLNVLQAITDWGNAVSAEAQSLLQYNIELANLELETGTILETHGIRFYEERFGSIGPLGRLHADQMYPRSHSPGPNDARYPTSNEPSENFFDLTAPYTRADGPPNRQSLELPAPQSGAEGRPPNRPFSGLPDLDDPRNTIAGGAMSEHLARPRTRLLPQLRRIPAVEPRRAEHRASRRR